MSFINIVLTIILTIAFGCTTAYFSTRQDSLSQTQNNLSQAMLDLQTTSMRANMSILINPQVDQQWTLDSNGALLTVNATIKNEGSREAILKNVDLMVTYHYSDDTPYTVTVRYFDLQKYCNIKNNTLPEDKETPFSANIFIASELLGIIGGSYSSHPATLVIGNSRSDSFTVSVTYFDGIGTLTTEQEFSTKP